MTRKGRQSLNQRRSQALLDDDDDDEDDDEEEEDEEEEEEEDEETTPPAMEDTALLNPLDDLRASASHPLRCAGICHVVHD
jgi:hypothetical protein